MMVNLKKINFINFNFFKSTSAQNVYISLFFKILTSLMFLIMVPFSIRTMGAAQYGITAFFLTMHGSVSLLDSGFTYALGLLYTRRLVHDSESAKNVFFSAVPIYLFLALFAVFVFTLYKEKLSQLAFNTDAFSMEMFIFGFVLALTTIDSMVGTVLQAHEKINLIATGRFLLDLVKVAGVAFMALSGAAPGAIIWFILISIIVKLIFDSFYLFKIIPSINIKIILNKIDYAEIKQLLKFALPSVGIAICSLANSMLDKFLVSGKISSSAFTSYSFAVDLTSKSYFLMYAITNVVYPKLIKSHSLGQSPSKLIKIQSLSLVVICLIYYIPLSFFSSQITTLLIGKELVEPTATLIKLCSLSAVMYLCFTLVETYLYTTGSTLKCLLVYIIGIFSFIFLLDYFLKYYQIYGAAIAVSLMFLIMIVSSLLLILFNKKKVV